MSTSTSRPRRNPNHSAALALLTTEYEQLKDEQRSRITVRDQLVGAAILAAVAVAGATNLAGPLLPLLLPPVCFALGWTYLATDQMIRGIGTYIRETLAPAAADLAGVEHVFGWEHTNIGAGRRNTRRRMSLSADLTVFVLPAVAALIFLALRPPALNGSAFGAFVLAIGHVTEIAGTAVLAWQFIAHSYTGRTPKKPAHQHAHPNAS